MIRSVELELKTISEANAREFWRVRAGRRADQREIVRKALCDAFVTRPIFDLVADRAGLTRLAQVVVLLTRIAPGELDPDENLPMSFKAIKDEIADWLGLKSDRDRRVRWRYGQERSSKGVYKIRIEIRDAAPGDDVRVQLATEAERAGALPVEPAPAPRDRRPPGPSQGVLPMMRCWMALPWEQPPAPKPFVEKLVAVCLACFSGGTDEATGEIPRVPVDDCGLCVTCAMRRPPRRLAPIPRLVRLADPPMEIEVAVPVEHLDRWPGPHVLLHRRRFKSRATGLCWLYEERTVST